ncbi:transcriptional repressor [Gemmatimonas aurantiaca]|nr:transcriptional repressor [Gemmatimonas aurantiaca]
MRDFLKTKGLKITSQRETIFRLFFESASHLTVEELHSRVALIDSSIAYTTVWRTLKLICDIGLAEKKYFGDGVVRYDRVTAKPHGHLVCQQCGETEEFFSTEINRLLQDRADESGFLPNEFRVEVVGVCLPCRQSDSKGLSADTQDSKVVDLRRIRLAGGDTGK